MKRPRLAKLQGPTAEQVADRAGITRTTLRRLEHGDPNVGLDVFLEVCRALAQSMLEQKRTLPDRVRR